MIRNILLLCTLLLSACGGGDSSPVVVDEKIVIPPNTPPTMSGVLTVEAKAMQKTHIVFDIADSENDILSLAIAEQPQWLSFELKNNSQVAITIEPDFFDIDNYELSISLSDGKDSNQYNLIVNVIDNPAQWRNIAITESELMGTWTNTDNGKLAFTFLSDAKGLYIVDDKLLAFEWVIDEIIEVNLREAGCFSTCGVLDFVELKLLAQAENKLRVEIETEDGVRQYVNLTKEHSTVLAEKSYIEVPQIEFNKISTIDVENNSVSIALSNIDVTLGDLVQTARFSFEGTLTAKQNHYDIQLTSENTLLENVYASFFNFQTNLSEGLNFKVVIDSAEIQSSAFGLLVVKTEYHAELLTDIEPAEYDAYLDLEQALKANFAYSVLHPPVLADTPDIVVGAEYSARLLTGIDIDIEGTNYVAGASVFKFTTDITGEAVLKVAGKNSSVTKAFSWAISEKTLAINFDGETRYHQFYQLPNGDLGLSVTTRVDGVAINTYIYEFNQVTELNVRPEQYIGDFKRANSAVFTQSNAPSLKIVEGGRGSNRYSGAIELDDFWKLEADQSISMINGFDCPDAFASDAGYDACFSEAMGGPFMTIDNYKLLSIVDDIYTFQYNYWYKNARTDQAIQSIRRFKKITQ